MNEFIINIHFDNDTECQMRAKLEQLNFAKINSVRDILSCENDSCQDLLNQCKNNEAHLPNKKLKNKYEC